MKRATILLIAATALVFAAPAAARTLSEATAYSVADGYAQRVADAAVWTDWWDDACVRRDPWRYRCTVYVGDDAATRECRQSFDIVSPFVGTRLRTELGTAWACYRPLAPPG